MPAYSCLQPQRHTYTDNNPQLNRCSSVNISWMADSSGLIIFFDLCLGFVFTFMNYKCMAKFVGKILISPPLHKVEVHSGKRVSAALLCLCREQIFTKHTPILLAAFNSIVDLNSASLNWGGRFFFEHHTLKGNFKIWQSSLVVFTFLVGADFDISW